MTNLTTECDWKDTGKSKPPRAGRDQTWRSYRADILKWIVFCEAPPENRVPIIGAMGLQFNKVLSDQTYIEGVEIFRDLEDGETGFERWIRHMDNLNETRSVHGRIRLEEELVQIVRGKNESMRDFEIRFRNKLKDIRDVDPNNARWATRRVANRDGEIVDGEKECVIHFMRKAGLSESQRYAVLGKIEIEGDWIRLEDVMEIIRRIAVLKNYLTTNYVESC